MPSLYFSDTVSDETVPFIYAAPPPCLLFLSFFPVFSHPRLKGVAGRLAPAVKEGRREEEYIETAGQGRGHIMGGGACSGRERAQTMQ